MGSGQGQDIDYVLAVLIIFVAAAVLVFETVTDILGMDALAVRTREERHDEDLAVVVVDVDIETDDGGQIAAAQKHAANRPYETFGIHLRRKFTKYSLFLHVQKSKYKYLMIQSMTGYGKGVAELENGKLTVEIRTLNSKNADINLKSSLLPKDKELSIRAKIASELVRGTIDIYLTWEPNVTESAKKINTALALDYYRQITGLGKEVGASGDGREVDIIAAVLRMPDVIDTSRQDVITEANWPLVEKAFDDCLAQVRKYREDEGAILYRDVTSRVANILALYDGVESHEQERIDATREKILKAAEDLQLKLDKERFEQEMIFYLEKLDINEEKVRLRQHCKYFTDTIDGEPYPGKKLGFIIQEMGREINTTGSKANNAPIQKLVVQMKDELEKIREQSMNIL